MQEAPLGNMQNSRSTSAMLHELLFFSRIALKTFSCVCSVAQSCLTFCGPMDLPGKTTGVGYHLLLQGIFLTQKSNPHLLTLLMSLIIRTLLNLERSVNKMSSTEEYSALSKLFYSIPGDGPWRHPSGFHRKNLGP